MWTYKSRDNQINKDLILIMANLTFNQKSKPVGQMIHWENLEQYLLQYFAWDFLNNFRENALKLSS